MLLKCLWLQSYSCLVYYNCSRSNVKGQGYSVKTSYDGPIVALFRKLRSLNLMAMSEFWSEARKWQFVRMCSTKMAKKQPRTTGATWGGLQVTMHSQWPLFVVNVFFVFHSSRKDRCQYDAAPDDLNLLHFSPGIFNFPIFSNVLFGPCLDDPEESTLKTAWWMVIVSLNFLSVCPIQFYL